MIPFNKPYLTGKEMHYIYQAVYSGKISGNGLFTKQCQSFLEEKYGFQKTLLTTSCTDALEMSAMLAGIGPEDEVIMPSYTFVSTALAFVRAGAKIVFADSKADSPNVDEEEIRKLQEELVYHEGFLASVLKKLSNDRFVANAPEKVIALERKKEADARARIATIKDSLAHLRK